jgi:hypothetical protein
MAIYKSPPPEVIDHPLFSGANSVGIMTADAPRFPASENGGELGLKRHLTNLGLKHESTHGSYGGPESSFIIHNPTREQMYHLGHAHGQEAVVYSQNGKHELLYTAGPNQGKFHPALPTMDYSKEKPDDYFTHLPGKGYIGLHFNMDQLHDSPVKDTVSADRLMQSPSQPPGQIPMPMAKSEFNQPRPWAGSFPWHEINTEHHKKNVGSGILLTGEQGANLMPLAKAEESKTEPPSYEKITAPFGATTGRPTNLDFYPMEGARGKVDQLVKDHGYTFGYHGGKYPKADHSSKNHDTFHLSIHDPGEDKHNDIWRKSKSLAEALTTKDVNKKYGEGKRVGPLGRRTLREALRTVEHGHLSAHKQRELAKQMGVHISEKDFNKEYNTQMADSVHRAILGNHSTPAEKGFQPHSHMVPLSTSLQMVKDHADKMGLK